MHPMLILLAAIAIPAGAYGLFAPGHTRPCFVSGASSFQIVPDATSSDVRVRIASDAPRPDLRMQLVDRPEIADFVLVDDFGSSAETGCPPSTPIRTVALDDRSAAPDVTVNLSADTGADYRIYIRSTRFLHHQAAALLAAIWQSDRRGETTGSIARR
jgi:hypothetical protein